MSSAQSSTGSHEHIAIVLSSPEVMCSCVCRGNYTNLGITEASGWTHLCWGCCPMSSRIFKQHLWPLVTRFQEVHLEKKIFWALSSDPRVANSLGMKTTSPAHSTSRIILQDLRWDPTEDQRFIKALWNTSHSSEPYHPWPTVIQNWPQKNNLVSVGH